MKKTIWVGVLVLALATASCGKLKDELNSLTQGNNGGGTPGPQPSPADASQVQFETGQGYVTYPKSSVNYVNINVQTQANPLKCTSRLFTNSSTIHVVAPFNLHAPNNGSPSNWQRNITGTVVISYDLGAQQRKLYIVNWNTLVDAQFQNTYYSVSGGTSLNSSWLYGQLNEVEDEGTEAESSAQFCDQ